ncbi:MAG: ADP compounds hydrolase NudE [Gammaproteobacteria bacterium]|nr:ADP compounds hydrolase NudE [Gammaproteobacteria bacterium]
MPAKPTILNSQTLARTRLFHIEQVELRFANGVETCYERLLGSPQGSVLIVPMLDDDTFLLVREYAAGIDRYELSLPKGRIEAGEELLAAANREIAEEVGYAAHHLHHLTSLSLAPGYLGHFTHIVLARDLYRQQRPGDEPEPLEVVPWRMDELHTLFRRDDCTEARSIAALFMTREYLQRG